MSEAAAEQPEPIDPESARIMYDHIVFHEPERAEVMRLQILPDEPVTGDWLIVRGRRYAVVNSWKEVESKDGRARWGIVTDENIV